MLCATREFEPENLSGTFGDHCVKISKPIEFFKRISIALNQHIKIEYGRMRPVKYRSRDYKGLEDPPGRIGFVKPVRYSDQKEFRMLWNPEKEPEIKPFLLECPEIAELCNIHDPGK